MNAISWNAFRAELIKLGYGGAEHTTLMKPTTQKMGLSGNLGKLMTKGNLATDKGLRHPWNPMNDAAHAMPGRAKKETVKRIMKTRQSGVTDVAKGIAKPGVLSGARKTRGLMNLGQTQHSVMDLGAHYERPVKEGLKPATARAARVEKGTRVARKVLSKTPLAGPAGTVISGAEHYAAGLTPKGAAPPSSEIDKLKPKGTNKIDDVSRGRAAGLGSSAKRDIIKKLQSAHGMTPQQAEKAYAQFASGKAPGPISQLIGKASRNSRYVKEQVTRPAKKAGSLLKSIVRRGVRKVVTRT
jgi:hypothetical protein